MSSSLYYPNRFARGFLSAMEDVMGQAALEALLAQGGLERYIAQRPPDDMARQVDFADLSALNQMLEENYGVRGGRGMALRIGRAAFSQHMRHFGALAGLADPRVRARPLEARARLGLEALAHVFNHFSDQHCIVDEEASSFLFQVEHSPFAWGRQSEKAVCHALAGMIQECTRWAANGREYYILETACTASGAPRCVFAINKTPIA